MRGYHGRIHLFQLFLSTFIQFVSVIFEVMKSVESSCNWSLECRSHLNTAFTIWWISSAALTSQKRGRRMLLELLPPRLSLSLSLSLSLNQPANILKLNKIFKPREKHKCNETKQNKKRRKQKETVKFNFHICLNCIFIYV